MAWWSPFHYASSGRSGRTSGSATLRLSISSPGPSYPRETVPVRSLSMEPTGQEVSGT